MHPKTDWDLASTNLHRLRELTYEVAVLPTGATEPHNLHLPCGQDTLAAVAVARRCVAAAWEQTRSVVLLPELPFGVDCNLLDFPMAIHVSQATLDAMIREIVTSLRHHGIRKVVIFNGHGGNNFSPLVRQLQCDLNVHLFTTNWWEVANDQYAQIFANRDDHAGEMETSVSLALTPKLVELDRASDGQAKPFRFEALQKGWFKTSRTFARLNTHCGVGDPRQATEDKGLRFLDITCKRITDFLVELAQAKIDEAFPH
ncbi:MAG: creatininase family protein [Phycisphaerae bacterium]|nr:creatininase family protein [Phycisphaerae bacterium]